MPAPAPTLVGAAKDKYVPRALMRFRWRLERRCRVVDDVGREVAAGRFRGLKLGPGGGYRVFGRGGVEAEAVKAAVNHDKELRKAISAMEMNFNSGVGMPPRALTPD